MIEQKECLWLISPEDVSCVDPLCHIVPIMMVAIGDNDLRVLFECLQIILDETAEEGRVML